MLNDRNELLSELNTPPTLDKNIQLASTNKMHEIQAAMTIAQHFPRNEHVAMQNILNACKRIKFATSATYSYKRGQSVISGASIRLAEIIARYMKHMDYGYTVVDTRDKSTLIEAYAVDYENNLWKRIQCNVPHEREVGGKCVPLTSNRDIYEHIANMASRRVRECILRLVPPDMVEAAIEACDETNYAEDREVPIADRVRTMVNFYNKHGIKVEHLEKRLGHSLDSVIHEELVELKSILRSIMTGETCRGDWFDLTTDMGKGMNGLRNLLQISDVTINKREQ